MFEQFIPLVPIGHSIKIGLLAIFYIALLILYFGSKFSIIILCLTFIMAILLTFFLSNSLEFVERKSELSRC